MMARMLEAGHRTTYVDLFAPPAGYRLTRAVGLTYSLDLTTLFAALLAMAGVEERSDSSSGAAPSSGSQASPAEKLRALLEMGDKVRVYCQAGKLRMGGSPDKVHSLLDKVVQTIPAQKEGSFHPKLWVLKFAKQDSFAKYSYRLVISSRNFSASNAYFEIVVALEGELASRSSGHNRELISFLAAKCGGLQELTELCRELSQVEFVPPPGFSKWFFARQRGAPHSERLFDRMQDCPFNALAIVSPFLADDFLRKILNEGVDGRPILVSTKEALDLVAEDLLDKFEAYYVRNRPMVSDAPEEGGDNPAGLHAKMLIGDRRGRTEFWVGSANASRRGWFGANTECMAVLYSDGYSVKRFREDFVWNKDKKLPRPWMIPYLRELDKTDQEKLRMRKEFEAQLEEYVGFLARGKWRLLIREDGAEVQFKSKEGNPLPRLPRIKLQSAKIGFLGGGSRLSLEDILAIGYGSLPISDKQALTEFLSVELKVGSPVREVKFLVQAEADFDKRKREDAVLREMIRSEQDFWQCFRLLVEGDGGHMPGGGGGGGGGGGSVVLKGVLETLLRECAREPQWIARVQRLLELAPPTVPKKELEAFWAVFQLAHQDVEALGL